MRLAVALLFVAACDAGKKPPAPVPEPAPPAPAPTPTVVVPDATVAAEPPPAPCSKEAIGADGDEQAVPTIDLDDCQFNEEHITDAYAKHRKPGAMRPQPLGHGTSFEFDGQVDKYIAVEARSPTELDRMVRCPRPIRVDWKREHAWIVTDNIPDGRMHVATMFDDGNTTTLGLQPPVIVCSGMNRPRERGYAVALVSLGRKVELRECVSPPSPPCPPDLP